jgi:hypothetical protein
MSRSGYSDDCDNIHLYRGAVDSAIGGKRGQQFLKDLLCALDEMSEKKLISDELEIGGEFCALGVVGRKRGVELAELNPEDSWYIGKVFNIAESMAREIVYMNDEDYWSSGWYKEESTENRWIRMREWVASNIKEDL